MPIWSRYLARTPLIVLGLAEAAILYVSVYAAAVIAFGGIEISEEAMGPLAPRAAMLSAVMLLSLIAMGLYQFHQRISFNEVLVRVLVGVALGSGVLAAAWYTIPNLTLQPKIAAVSMLCALSALLALRFAFMQHVDQNLFRRRTLVFGAGERSAPISELRRKADRRGFKVVAKIPALGDTSLRHCEYLLQSDKSLTEIALEKNADEIVIAMDDRRGNLPVRELLDCKLKGIEVIDLLEFLERETGKIRLDLVNPGWLIFSPGFRITRLRRAIKRILDLVVAGMALLVSWPVMLLVALAIKFFDGWDLPVIYKQRRVGYHGDTFNVFKFRSMRVDAEADGKARWASEDDPRVTRIGAVLRKYRLDELPQIFNVLAGQMSVVGPRPERPEFVEELEESIPYYAERHSVKPGVTGWAQLKYAYGATRDDAIEKLQYDLYYIKNHNLLLDLMIILQTAEVILWGKGAR